MNKIIVKNENRKVAIKNSGRKICINVCRGGGTVDIKDQVGNIIQSIIAPGEYQVLVVGAIRDTRPQAQPVDFAIKDPRI